MEEYLQQREEKVAAAIADGNYKPCQKCGILYDEAIESFVYTGTGNKASGADVYQQVCSKVEHITGKPCVNPCKGVFTIEPLLKPLEIDSPEIQGIIETYLKDLQC